MNNPKIISVGIESLIQVTFNNGLDDPCFTVENIHFDADGEKCALVACLKACAKLLNDKAESLESEFEKTRKEGLIK